MTETDQGWDPEKMAVRSGEPLIEMDEVHLYEHNGDVTPAEHVAFYPGGWVKLEVAGTTHVKPRERIRSVHNEVLEDGD